ncbi:MULTISPECIES: response regulator [unclassified Modestobacter]|uniref:response regulator n=1 Tax=unclassified Modestobacter TaxID=2643866 RepID=UPI0022AA2DA1|nr:MULTISPECIES: response regulator transcription factor [unclassified Modestobacter]MCZ2805329.1 response regulator transcription factor [Modestobacter sp. VKM Ac-2983]MCZ2848835.1 response regulator transcription factor [Modestobacter sp. VKM Ac-2978]
MIRLLLVDDQALLRHGMTLVLEGEDDLTVVGEASDGAGAVEQAVRLRPDVVLMDVRMPGMDGIEATRRLAALVPEVRVLILTTFDLDEHAFAGLRAGASGFLLKDVPPAELAGAVRAVARGDAVMAPTLTRRLLDAYAHRLPTGPVQLPRRGLDHPALARLTDREREVLGELAGGLSNAEIAARLVLSETTVKTHVSRLLHKLQLRDRVQAVIVAYETGLAPRG